MAKKTDQPKAILEREYIVPLRKEFLKVPEYKRANKATKALKEFLAQHMKVYDRDLKKIKLDVDLNNELRFRGMKKPLAKIKVKATKYDDEIVRVELAELPKVLQYKKARQDKKSKDVKKKVEEIESQKQPEELQEEVKEETSKQTLEKKEKQETSKEATMEMEDKKAKEAKHISTEKETTPKDPKNK